MARITEEEARRLVEYFHAHPSCERTDSHPACRELAKELGRSPASVERHLRNILYLTSDGKQGLSHGSRVLREVLGVSS